MSTEADPATPQDRKRFLRRLTVATGAGKGLDGYDLGIISVVLPMLTTDLDMSAAAAGLIGASSLIGIFLGGPIFGRVTDRYGRRLPFAVNMFVFLALGVAQALAPTTELLFVFRLLLGMAIGAEYAIGSPMLSEFAPAERRGRYGAVLETNWYWGFFISVVIGYALLDLAGLGWRLILASSVLPAIITIVLRRGLPESPRWLVSRGREKEARVIATRYMGDEEYFDCAFGDEEKQRGGLSELLQPPYRGRLIMMSTFWAFLIAPYFAIVTFAPKVFGAVGLAEHSTTIAENAIGVLGAAAGLLVMDRLGRRPMLIVPFWICFAALLVVGVVPGAPVIVLGAAFVTFAFFNALAADLVGVYPNELFPTHLRTSAVGIGAASSRIGAAIGTFLLPVGIDSIGIGPSMLVGAGFCLAGALTCQFFAPETQGQSLAEAADPDLEPAAATA